MKLKIPFTEKELVNLKAGQVISLTGAIYTARDRAHRRFIEIVSSGRELPFDLEHKVMYYCGPNIKGDTLGACGPTTASRMDAYTEWMYSRGVLATIGKGQRDPQVRFLTKKYKRVYFVTHAGCGAYLRNHIESFQVAAFRDLGPEAVYEFSVKDFPVIVAIDTKGNDIYARLSSR